MRSLRKSAASMSQTAEKAGLKSVRASDCVAHDDAQRGTERSMSEGHVSRKIS